MQWHFCGLLLLPFPSMEQSTVCSLPWLEAWQVGPNSGYNVLQVNVQIEAASSCFNFVYILRWSTKPAICLWAGQNMYLVYIDLQDMSCHAWLSTGTSVPSNVVMKLLATSPGRMHFNHASFLVSACFKKLQCICKFVMAQCSLRRSNCKFPLRSNMSYILAHILAGFTYSCTSEHNAVNFTSTACAWAFSWMELCYLEPFYCGLLIRDVCIGINAFLSCRFFTKWNWIPIFVLNWFLIFFFFTTLTVMGIIFAVKQLVHDIDTFKIFATCYQCPTSKVGWKQRLWIFGYCSCLQNCNFTWFMPCMNGVFPELQLSSNSICTQWTLSRKLIWRVQDWALKTCCQNQDS